jgi:hypothetical protein
VASDELRVDDVDAQPIKVQSTTTPWIGLNRIAATSSTDRSGVRRGLVCGDALIDVLGLA